MGNYVSTALFACVLHDVVGETFDVVIIGSGPGGLVAGEYLSRNASISVLILEGGGPSLASTGGTDIPSYAQSEQLTRFDIPGEYSNIAFSGDNKYRINTDWIASPQNLWLGKVVGGSSSLNGMLYFHTPDSYVKESNWPFDASAVNQGFAAIESMFSFTNNPSPDGKRYLQEAYNIMGTVLNSAGYKESQSLNADRNAKSKSFGHPPFAIKNGLRDSPAKTFLGAAKARANFKLLSSATVSYIVQAQGKATGVVYQYQGQTVTATLSSRGAVVVAGGAVMTPKILIQSGIGPSSQLQMLSNNANFPGIGGLPSKWVVNENVGSSLFDTQQLLLTLSHKNMKTFVHTQSPSSAIQQYMTQGHSGPWSSPDPVQIAYENYNFNNREYQFQLTTFCHGFNGGSNQVFGAAVYVNNPVARDAARFTNDGKYHLDTYGSLYSNSNDRAAMASYLDKLRSFLASNDVATIIPAADQPSQNFVNSQIQGANHYGGSCYASGDTSDSKRCTNENFLVVGTKNLFVGDGSLMKEGTVNPYGFIMYAGYQTGVNVAKFIAQTSQPAVTCTNYENDVDYNGNDIGSTQRSSADGCCADCAAKSGCVLYVWTNHNGGTCWLKSAKGQMSSKLGAKAGFITSSSTPVPTSPSTPTPVPQGECSNYEEDVDYYGSDIGSTQRSSADSCCADCSALPGCTLYVWNNFNGGTCWLKNGRGQKSVKQGCKAATLSNTCSKPESNIDFTGQDVASVPGTSPAECCVACKSNKACNAYTLWNNICWLKSGHNSRSNASGTIAAIVNKCSTLEISIDYVGNDIGKADAAVADDCCAICRNTVGCKAFSWYSGACYLKSAKGSSISKSNVISAVVVM